MLVIKGLARPGGLFELNSRKNRKVKWEGGIHLIPNSIYLSGLQINLDVLIVTNKMCFIVLDHFNLVVPLLPKQMLLFDLEKEAERILLKEEHRKPHDRKEYLTEKNNPKDQSSVLSTFSSLFGL